MKRTLFLFCLSSFLFSSLALADVFECHATNLSAQLVNFGEDEDPAYISLTYHGTSYSNTNEAGSSPIAIEKQGLQSIDKDRLSFTLASGNNISFSFDAIRAPNTKELTGKVTVFTFAPGKPRIPMILDLNCTDKGNLL